MCEVEFNKFNKFDKFHENSFNEFDKSKLKSELESKSKMKFTRLFLKNDEKIIQSIDFPFNLFSKFNQEFIQTIQKRKEIIELLDKFYYLQNISASPSSSFRDEFNDIDADEFLFSETCIKFSKLKREIIELAKYNALICKYIFDMDNLNTNSTIKVFEETTKMFLQDYKLKSNIFDWNSDYDSDQDSNEDVIKILNIFSLENMEKYLKWSWACSTL